MAGAADEARNLSVSQTVLTPDGRWETVPPAGVGANGMTLKRWLETPVRAEWLREILEEPTGREFLAVLWQQMPLPVLVSQEQTALLGAQTAGYAKCLATVNLMARVVKPTNEVEADYGGTNSDGDGAGESGAGSGQ